MEADLYLEQHVNPIIFLMARIVIKHPYRSPKPAVFVPGARVMKEIKRAERACCLRFFLPFILPNIILIARIVRKHPY